MPHELLRTRLRRRRRQRRREMLIIALFALLLVFWFWHFFVYARTPEYALHELQSAAESHDPKTFDRYINLELLTMTAYDDLTMDLFKYDASLTPQTKALFKKFYVLIKPQMAQGTADTIRRYAATGEWTLPEGSDILKGRQLGIDYDRFLERSQLRNTELVKIGSIKVTGKAATAEIHIKDRYTQTPFILRLHMEQVDDGRWQVSYIENYRDYLDTVAPLQNQDIANYIAATQSIVDSYNQKFVQQRARFHDLTQTANGRLSPDQIKKLTSLLEDEVIPDLKARQEKLNAASIHAGSQYLAELRRQSTELTVAVWQHFSKGLKENNNEEFNTAETLHKQELDIDLRIEDIIRHNTVSQAIPAIP